MAKFNFEDSLFTNFYRFFHSLKNQLKVKLNAGIITSKLQETKEFYTGVLNFGVTFENEFYLLLHTSSSESEISFLLPDHPSQQQLLNDHLKAKAFTSPLK